ncbi:MAG: DUF1657 domain-containing protein [Candidatus Syntrophonatronum acetioxidans]|uniref:DUF1657 domain-containing protein n=1 Tax=Candidatus Syntrophonatronum acetioxidans TaxID=1795816 RepID=A0A424Y9B1_9FIRM|nr:MAG: DUF1657 domain-containing protein [Candidatus Syntrophonatronum acetioxidans]
MTVGSQLKQCIAGVQNAAATMKSFALETQDQEAKKTFEELARTLDNAVSTLEKRQEYVQGQEPQYK